MTEDQARAFIETKPTEWASIEDQIDEMDRAIRDCARRYPALVAAGRLRPETAHRKLWAKRRARASLAVLAKHQDWIRPEIQRRIDAAAIEAELASEPAVTAARDAWPDAEARVVDYEPQPEPEDA